MGKWLRRQNLSTPSDLFGIVGPSRKLTSNNNDPLEDSCYRLVVAGQSTLIFAHAGEKTKLERRKHSRGSRKPFVLGLGCFDLGEVLQEMKATKSVASLPIVVLLVVDKSWAPSHRVGADRCAGVFGQAVGLTFFLTTDLSAR